MSLPQALSVAIAQGLQHVQQSPEHHLPLGYRQAIWDALGPEMDARKPRGGSGHQRRMLADAMAVQHVLPMWDAMWPENRTPHEVLDSAQQVLNGQGGDDEAIDTSIRYLWTDYDDACYAAQTTDQFVPVVLLASVKVLKRAWNDLDFRPSRYALSATDGQQGYHNTDAAYDASVAYGHGLPWDTASDAAKRQEFWEWWLTAAVPAAYEAVSENA